MKAIPSVALDQWRCVDFRVDFEPSSRSVVDRNGVVVSVAYQKPYTFEMPDKIPTIALLPPPHCGVCIRPISKLQIICTPDGASIEASCHGQSNSKFLFIESLTSRGPNSIYQEMLEAFSYKGAFQKSEGLKDFDGWKMKDGPALNKPMPDLFKFNSDKGRKAFEEVAKRARKEIMEDDRWKKMKNGSSFSDEVILRSSRAPDCCLCRKPVKIYCRNDYQRDGYEVTFECHGRREVTFVGTEQTKFRGISLEEFISNMNPFVSDFKRLNIPEEPPKQKPKPRTGLTITIGQERIINLE
mgnify:CR=1 FL=1